MAAPHIIGVMALMLSANPNLTHDQVHEILAETALFKTFNPPTSSASSTTVDSQQVEQSGGANTLIGQFSGLESSGRDFTFPTPNLDHLRETPNLDYLRDLNIQTPNLDYLRDLNIQTPNLDYLQDLNIPTPNLDYLQDLNIPTPNLDYLRDLNIPTPNLDHWQNYDFANPSEIIVQVDDTSVVRINLPGQNITIGPGDQVIITP